MVATRHSLPIATGTTASPPPPCDPKTAAALKKLEISGTGALVGEKVPEHTGETYVWRGHKYAVTADTKPEWVENEPERYKRQKRKRESMAREPDEDGWRSLSPGVTRKRRKVSGLGPDTGERPRVRRSSTPAVEERKPRQSRKGKRSAAETKPVMKPETLEETATYQEAKSLARKMGYQVDAITQEEIRGSRVFGRTVARSLLEIVKLNGKIKRLEEAGARAKQDLLEAQEKQQKRVQARTAQQSEEDASMVDNELIIPQTQQLDGASDIHPQQPKLHAAHDSAFHTSPTSHNTPTTSSPPQDAVPSTTIPSSNAAGTRASASLPPNSKPSIAEVTTPLPTTNKSGNRLRWSLPDRLTDEEMHDAAAAIVRARMEGESKSAKRRRVRRELAVVRGWQVEKVDEVEEEQKVEEEQEGEIAVAEAAAEGSVRREGRREGSEILGCHQFG